MPYMPWRMQDLSDLGGCATILPILNEVAHMLVVASANGRKALPAALDALLNGGSAVDAVETGIRIVESDPDEDSVGFGGVPNLCGELEMDASIMDGATLKSGAVAAIRNCMYPISVARRVLDLLPYELLVGAGAELFARECGFEAVETRTAEGMSTWQQRLQNLLSADGLGRLVRREGLIEATRELWRRREQGHGTTNLIARDTQGNIAAGVSTTGLALKYPGRVGDSPIVGAGNYADSRYGAATCTGFGEMAIRAGTARSVILYLKMGMGLQAALMEAMQDLRGLWLPWKGGMNVVAIDADGRHCGASTRPDDVYVYMAPGMSEPADASRIHIPLANG